MTPPSFFVDDSGYILMTVPLLAVSGENGMMGVTDAVTIDIRPRLAGEDDGNDGRGNPGGAVVTRTRPKTQRPSMYKVLLLNDDYTPMEFVVHVLERFFGLNNAQAVEIMLTVHRKGVAVVGVFSYEIAETKVTQVMEYARRNEHPLQCTMEKE
jgi:ATP-dependent Clp protease adaptor protein ClpS